jgi:hypothetical protein
MSQIQQMSVDQPGPHDPPPQEEPTHDVPVYPEKDPPQSHESAMEVAAKGRSATDPTGREDEGEPLGDPVEPEDVDEDDLDPRKPHHPPDVRQEKILFDENYVPS